MALLGFSGKIGERAGSLGVRMVAKSARFPIALTEWGRGCIASLIASARMERRQIPGVPSIEELDVRGAFGLALPLLRLRGEPSGSCALEVDLDEAGGSVPAGVTARFQRGRLASWQPGLAEDADARAWGNVDGWFRAVIEGRLDGMAAAGDTRLATAILEALHERLFGFEE